MIIGCGNIAGRFDHDRPAGAEPLTHAGVYARNPAFEIVACVDPDETKRSQFMERWGIGNGYANLRQALDVGVFDVVSICSPTASHAADLLALLEATRRPRFVFCEKPMASSVAEAEAIYARYRADGVPLAINYTRRFDPVVTGFAAELRSGAWGAVRSASGVYNKGLLNNGSHMIDLLHLLLGPLTVQYVGAPLHDYWPNDPSAPAVLATADRTPVALNCGHAADYALFELAIVTERGVLAMEDGGLQWRLRRARPSTTFAGYSALGASEMRPGGIDRAMTRAITEISDAVRGNCALSCTADDALAAQRLCETIAMQASGKTVRISSPQKNGNGR